MKTPPYVNWYASDFLSGCLTLPSKLRDLYGFMLSWQANSGAISDADGVAISGILSRDIAEVKAVLEAKFEQDENGDWINRRMMAALSDAGKAYNQKVAAGRAGAKARWGNGGANSNANGASNGASNGGANANQNQNHIKKKRKKKAAPPPPSLDQLRQEIEVWDAKGERHKHAAEQYARYRQSSKNPVARLDSWQTTLKQMNDYTGQQISWLIDNAIANGWRGWNFPDRLPKEVGQSPKPARPKPGDNRFER